MRLALDGDANQVGGLVVQTIGHVEVGFRERIAPGAWSIAEIAAVKK